MGENGQIGAASTGGISGEHAAPDPFHILVGPSTGAEFNAVHLPLVPVACWAIDDIRFAFDSSFVDADCSGGGGPPEDIRLELAMLKEVMKTYPGSPLSLFGHADPVGNDDYNKKLSERRARAIYALLIFQSEPDTAVGYWQTISATENWGADQQQRMQDLVGGGTGATGSALIRAYLKTLSSPAPLLAKTDFLAQGAGPDRKGDFQGCSEFNPLLLFSQEKQTQFEQAKANNDPAGIADRDSQNAPNRRVLGLLFRKGSKIDPAKWPCPRAANGIAGCVKRFWPDGDTRRGTHLSGLDRKFPKTHDTFACRFYQRLTKDSPCDSLPGIPLVLARFVGLGNERKDTTGLMVRNGQGELIATILASHATVGAQGFAAYIFDPRVLPNPVLLDWRTPYGEEHLAGPCDPVNLRDILHLSELPVAEPLVEPDSGSDS